MSRKFRIVSSTDLSSPVKNRRRSGRDALTGAVCAWVEGLEGRVLFNAAITPTNIAAPSDTELVTIDYTSTSSIDPASFSKNDITVTDAANHNLTVTGVTTSAASANDVTAVYTIAPPSGGSWTASNDGTYTVNLPANTAADTTGAPLGPATSSFTVSVPDTTAPTATINPPADVTVASNNPATFNIIYSDDVAVAALSGSAVPTVQGPNGSLPVSLTGTTPSSGNAQQITANYSIAAPLGGWSTSDNGNYSINLAAGTVQDTAGNPVGAAGQQFQVSVAAPVDTTPPTASISAPDVTSAGGNTEQITIVYSDDTLVTAGSIGANDLTVTGPAGTLNFKSVSKSPNQNAGTITATYTVSLPGGRTWNSGANGTYTISLAGNAVRDTSNNPVAASTKTFTVNIAAPDTAPPTASIQAADVTAPGAAVEIVTVTYSDAGSGVNANTVDNGSLTVTGPGGPLSLVTLSKLPTVSGPTVTAVYTFAAPGGVWSPASNGNYTVSVVAGHVKDIAGNALGALTRNFNVNAGVLDLTPPGAAVAASDITSPGGTSETITVTYTDSGSGVNAQTIDSSDINVSGPSGSLNITGVHTSATPNGVVATYIVSSPAGHAWNSGDNGVYTISVAAGSVKDNAGNGVAATGGAFTVSAAVPDTTPPSATISAPAINTASTDPQTVTVVYHDPNSNVSAASLGLGNISVSGPQGPLSVASFAASPSGDVGTITVTYTVNAPLGGWSNANNGNYTVALNAGQVKDPSGNAAAVTTAQFAVNIAAPGDPSDTTFNGGQPVTAPFVAEAVVPLANGQLLLIGHQGNLLSRQSTGVLERLNADGTVDKSFGGNGTVTSAAGSNFAYYAVVQQGADHLIVAGTDGTDFLLQRFDLNGNLDASFGSGGTTLTSFGGTGDSAFSVALTSSGQIVAGGASSGNFAFARYDANGHLDTSFAQGGLQLFQVGASNGAVGSIVVQSNGFVVAAGAAGAGVAVVRLNTNGEADSTFGNGGLAMVNGLAVNQNLGFVDHSLGLSLQGNNLLVAKRTSNGHFGLVRLLPDGSVDSSFGAGGMATADFGGNDDADSIVQENTGQILVIGTSLLNSAPVTAVAAFDANGNPIAAFGSGGKSTFSAAASSTTRELHIGDLVVRAFGAKQSNGQVVVGTSGQSVSSPSTTALRRLIVPGSVGATPAETFLGAFGTVGKKSVKLTFTVAGTAVTLLLKGATGNAFLNGNQVRLSITQSGTAATSLTVTTKGGTRSVSFSDITVAGAIRTLTAKTADLNGTFYATSSIGNAAFRAVATGAAIVSGGTIGNLTLASLTGARIISGANLGSSGQLSSSTTFGPGSIGAISVSGSIAQSIIAAGVNAIGGDLLNPADTAFGGKASFIKSVTGHGGIDANSRIIVGKIGPVKAPKVVKLPDPRIVVLPG